MERVGERAGWEDASLEFEDSKFEIRKEPVLTAGSFLLLQRGVSFRCAGP
jgi:hypothetical protein